MQENSMRRTLQKAGWALSLAGSLGLTAVSVADPVPGRGAAPAQKVAATPAVCVSKSSALLAEMNVELAWLRDPLTFPHQLAAMVEGQNLVVGGVVPDQTIRAQAIKIAKETGGLPVIDKLTIGGKHVPAAPSVSPPEL